LERALVARRRARHALYEAAVRTEDVDPDAPLPTDVAEACKEAMARLNAADDRLRDLTRLADPGRRA
jgi:hypothetical protein